MYNAIPQYGAYPYQYNNPYQYNGAIPDTLNQFKNPYQIQNQGQALQNPIQNNNQSVQPSQMAQNPVQNPSTTNNDMIWVLGEIEATSYPVAPNNTVVLWDKNNKSIYLKSVDSRGIPSMRILDYSVRNEDQPVENTSLNYVKIDDFHALEEKVNVLSNEVNSVLKSRKKTIEKEMSENE